MLGVPLQYKICYWPHDAQLSGDIIVSDRVLGDDRLLWVDVSHGEYKHRLQGNDYYWFLPDFSAFGVIQDTLGQDFSYCIYWNTEKKKFIKENLRPPQNAIILEGIEIPDDIAKQLNLL